MYPVDVSRAVTAVFHHLAPHAKIIGIDHIQGLVDMAKENLTKDGIKLGAEGQGVEIICGDGRLGMSAHLWQSQALKMNKTSGSPENGESWRRESAVD